jgi:hypothetical protein
MRAISLQARLMYAVVAVPLGGAVGFYLSIYLLPKLSVVLTFIDTGSDGRELFEIALGVGTLLAFTAAMVALTLPWKRHRKRRGRTGRIGVTCAVVVLASVSFAAEVHSLVYDLVFAAWLAYVMSYTFVRYGVVDQQRRRSAAATGSTGNPYE